MAMSPARGTSLSSADESMDTKANVAEKEGGGRPGPRRSTSRRSIASSTDTDPLEPLELAMSNPSQQFPSERMTREHSAHRVTATVSSNAAAEGEAPAGAGVPEDDEAFEVDFEGDDDQDNPKNWSLARKSWAVFCVSFATWIVVLYSTNYTASIPGLMIEFGVSSTPLVTLGVTSYLVGLAAGSLVVAPLSELYGRKIVYVVSLVLFTIFVIPCGLATSLEEIIIVRFVG